jgi:hypothetical protein
MQLSTSGSHCRAPALGYSGLQHRANGDSFSALEAIAQTAQLD